MLLSNKIRLADIPAGLRVQNESVYITAFRVSRNVSDEWYHEDLQVLEDDLLTVDDTKHLELFKLLQSYKK